MTTCPLISTADGTLRRSTNGGTGFRPEPTRSGHRPPGRHPSDGHLGPTSPFDEVGAQPVDHIDPRREGIVRQVQSPGLGGHLGDGPRQSIGRVGVATIETVPIVATVLVGEMVLIGEMVLTDETVLIGETVLIHG